MTVSKRWRPRPLLPRIWWKHCACDPHCYLYIIQSPGGRGTSWMAVRCRAGAAAGAAVACPLRVCIEPTQRFELVQASGVQPPASPAIRTCTHQHFTRCGAPRRPQYRSLVRCAALLAAPKIPAQCCSERAPVGCRSSRRSWSGHGSCTAATPSGPFWT
jgi:hypothetical protein